MSDEPIIGWRCWRWNTSKETLFSTVYGTPWPVQEKLTARCFVDDPDAPICLHCPMADCTCGIHAWSDRTYLDRIIQLEPYGFPVWGQVSLWGRIVECERGYRAQYAYPYSLLILPEYEMFRSRLRDRYAVDVQVL